MSDDLHFMSHYSRGLGKVVAYCVERPGVAGLGDTHTEAHAGLTIALKGWDQTQDKRAFRKQAFCDHYKCPDPAYCQNGPCALPGAGQ